MSSVLPPLPLPRILPIPHMNAGAPFHSYDTADDHPVEMQNIPLPINVLYKLFRPRMASRYMQNVTVERRRRVSHGDGEWYENESKKLMPVWGPRRY